MSENPLTAVEIANRRVWVYASPEIVVELQKGWSRPIQATIGSPNPDGSFEMTFRTAEGAERALATTARQVLTDWPEVGYDGQEYGHLYRMDEVDPLLERLEDAVTNYEQAVRLTEDATAPKG